MKKIPLPPILTGAWLDQETAFIIRLKEEDVPDIQKVKSKVESRVRIPGETKVFARFGQAFLDDQEKKQHRQAHERHRFFQEILPHFAGAAYIVVFGPGQAKHGLANEIEKDPLLKGKLAGVEAADRITKAQMVQWVKNYYTSDAFRELRKKRKKEKSLH